MDPHPRQLMSAQPDFVHIVKKSFVVNVLLHIVQINSFSPVRGHNMCILSVLFSPVIFHLKHYRRMVFSDMDSLSVQIRFVLIILPHSGRATSSSQISHKNGFLTVYMSIRQISFDFVIISSHWRLKIGFTQAMLFEIVLHSSHTNGFSPVWFSMNRPK